MRNLETISQVATLVLTVAVVILTAIGVIYAARTYWNPPIELSIAGVSSGQTLCGTAVLRIDSTGRPYDTLCVCIDDERGNTVWQCAVDSSAPVGLDTTELPDGEYVMVIDVRKGRSSLKTTMLPFQIDNTGPDVTVSGLAGNDTVRGTITLAWSVAPPDETASIQVLLDEEVIIGAGLLDTRWLVDGYHTIRASAADRIGNRTHVVIPFVSDNTPPTASIVGIAPSGYIGIDQEITVIVEDTSPVTVEWYASNMSEEPIAVGPILSTDVLPTGQHVLRVEIKDAAGNQLILEQPLVKDGELPSVQDALGHETLTLHPESFLYLGYSADEPVTQVVFVDGEILERDWVRLSDIAKSDEINVTVQYTDRAANKLQKSIVVTLDRSLAGTVGFIKHLGWTWGVSVEKSIVRTLEDLVESWSAIGVGTTGWRMLPPWEEEQDPVNFVRLPGGVEIYSSLPKSLFGARVPLFSLGRSGSEATSHLLLDIGGYQRTDSQVTLAQGEVDGAPWVYDQTIVTGAWMKLCPTVDLAKCFLPASVKDLISIEISVGAGVSLHAETRRLASLKKHTDRDGDVHSHTTYEPRETSSYGGMFPVFQLAISIAPLSPDLDLRDAFLGQLR